MSQRVSNIHSAKGSISVTMIAHQDREDDDDNNNGELTSNGYVHIERI